jgi:lipid-binding SYLF domain-containing protein
MRRSARFIIASALAVSGATFTGCTSGPEPQTPAKRETLSIDSEATLRRMSATDPGFQDFLDKAYGYAIFPSIGKGGFVVGGSYGRGEVYRGGDHVGFADVTAVSAGLLAGGQTISQVIVFGSEKAFNDFTRGEWGMGANASVVALKAGAAAGAQFKDGVVAFVDTRGGLMGDLSLEGQKFRYTARTDSDGRTASYRDDKAAAEQRDQERELRAEQNQESRELQQEQQKAREELRDEQQDKQRELRSEQRDATLDASPDAEAEIKVDAPPPAKTDAEKDGPSIRGEVEIGPDAADKQ